MANFASLRTSQFLTSSRTSDKNTRDLFRLLVEKSTDIITVLTQEGDIRYENPRIFDVFGYRPTERIGTNAFQFIHADDVEEVQQTFQQLLHEGHGAIRSASFRYKHKDGSWLHLDSVGINLIEDPIVKGVLVNSHDISNIKETEEKLVRKEKELVAAQRIAHVGSWRWDIRSGELEWSQELFSIYGISTDAPISYEIFLYSAATDEERSYVERVIAKAIEEKGSFSYVHAIKLPNGGIKYLDSRGRVNCDNFGAPTELVGVCRDVTSEWEAQKELSESNRRLEDKVAERTKELNRINDMLIDEYDRMNFLSQTGAILASSLNYKETLRNLAAFVVPHYADWCAVDIIDEKGDLHQFTVAHKDKDKIAWAEQLHQQYPPLKESVNGVYEAVRTRKTLVFKEIDPEFLKRVAQDEKHLQLLKGVGFTSAIIVPLYVADKSLGAISFMRSSHESNSYYTDQDVKFFERLAYKASLHIHNAQLYTQAHDEIVKRRALEKKWRKTYSELNKANQLLGHHVAELEFAKSALEHEKSKDEAILENIGEGLIVVDNNDHIILANKAAEVLMKVKREDIIGKHASLVMLMEDEKGDLVPYEQRPCGKSRTKSFAQVTTSDNKYYKRADGTRFPVSVVASQFSQEGIRKGSVIVFKDVTKEKEIDEAKNDFISIASHQLRTPLSTINWYSETLLMQAESKNYGEKHTKYIKNIHSANLRLIRLVNSLLNVSRLELGTVVVEPQPVHLVKLVKEIILDLKGEILERGVSLTEEFEDNLPHIPLDPKISNVIFQNLISNAIKYIPNDRERKEVTVKVYVGGVPKRGAVPQKSGDGIVVEVSDNGYGISHEDRKKIFGKFFRADVTHESNSEGSGLGLYITKQLTELMGGKIWLRSRVNKGTTFFLFLPKQFVRPQLPLQSEHLADEYKKVGIN